MSKFTNHLINETSPYLLQHANNPVDWHPWNKETLDKAKKEDKMMLVSIGYSACHWCHVMERESFENEDVARVMNDNFICVKVDREERPDLDAVYMNAVQLIHGNGGWPLNCFTLPDGRPFYGGTYFQTEKWMGLLENVSRLFSFQRNDIEEQAKQITEGIKSDSLIKLGENNSNVDRFAISKAFQNLERNFDRTNGGFKGAPKFPLPNNLIFLLRYFHHSKNSELEKYIRLSLDKMAAGGIYDQVGGGFSRYSVDDAWHIPHFEKMLYDNAQLISLYTEGYQLFKNNDYLSIAEDSANFVLLEMTSPEGLFYSALDADSDGEEGNFYVWTKQEFDKTLAGKASLMGGYFGIQKEALWEDEKNVLVTRTSVEDFTRQKQLGLAEFNKMLKETKNLLYKRRSDRTRPGLDDKCLTSWNALMIKAFTDLYNATGKKTYLNSAVQAADLIQSKLATVSGGLFHNYKNGEASINGFLEDYAFFIQALIELYQATFNEDWLLKANDLMKYVLSNFFDEADGFFWFTDKQTHDLVARKKEIHDSVMPSSNSVIALCLFKLGDMMDKQKYKDIAVKMLANLMHSIGTYPSSFSNWLNFALFAEGPFVEVAVTGPEADILRCEMASQYLPLKIILGSKAESGLPLLVNKYFPGKNRIYICTNKTCKPPVESVEEAILLIYEINHQKSL